MLINVVFLIGFVLALNSEWGGKRMLYVAYGLTFIAFLLKGL